MAIIINVVFLLILNRLTKIELSLLVVLSQHEQYNNQAASFANDIAILTLQTAINIGGNIAAAQLPPNNNDDFAGDNCVITGWGRTCE